MRYFAYCTLMDIDAMRVYCPTAQPDGLAFLPDSELTFATYGTGDPRGGCTIRSALGERLYGIIYQVAEEEARGLEDKSGVAEGWYATIELLLTRLDGSTVESSTLVIPGDGEAFSPTSAYVAPIIRGALNLRLPAEYVQKLESIIAYSIA